MGNRDVSKPNNDGEPCDDCISRQAVLSLPRNKVRDLKTMEVVCETINVTDIETLPPGTPQPKTGYWMIVEDSIDRFFATYECSCCKRAIIVPHDAMKAVCKDYPYCHCGAKMAESRKARKYDTD